MSHPLAAVLFQSVTRSAVLDLLFVRGVAASVSELARRAGLSTRSVANEVRHLLPTGLVLVDTVGGADVVRANSKHAGARYLRGLLQTPSTLPEDTVEARKTRESLAAWGAPLATARSLRHYSLNESLLRGLTQARTDGTVLRVLPSVFARHLTLMDWPSLREDARRKKLKAELGLMVELTAQLLERPDLTKQVVALRDKRRRTMSFFSAAKSGYEEELAKQRSPAVAKRWGFWMNMSEESFRSTLEKHRA